MTNLQKVVNHILLHPETWYQEMWHCDTCHCIAGHAQIMAGKPIDANCCFEDAMEYLGLSEQDAAWLFSHNRTLAEIYTFAADGKIEMPLFTS